MSRGRVLDFLSSITTAAFHNKRLFFKIFIHIHPLTTHHSTIHHSLFTKMFPFSFAYPFLLAALLVLPFIYWYVKNKETSSTSTLLFSDIRMLPVEKTWKVRLRNFPLILRLLALGCCIVALARPQEKNDIEITDGQGIDIVLCLDVSGSMAAKDLTPTRLDASREMASSFIAQRKGDRIGLVIFSGESFTLSPLTTDKAMLQNQLAGARSGLLKDGTSIGSGLATGVDRLKNSKAKSKVIILLTDGEDTGGLIDPQTAKELAKTFGIRVYTIGVGTQGYAPIDMETPLGKVTEQQKVGIDEELLKQIAKETNGQYYRATDRQELGKIYASIDHLEKSKIENTTFHKRTEHFQPWLIAALLLLFLEGILRYSYFRKFP